MDATMICKKESIIFTTIDLINELGIQAVSTREIAKRQGISQSAIFQYFPKKNDLILAVLEQFSQYDNDIFSTAKLKNKQNGEAIRFYIESYLLYYENYPAITSIMQAFDIFRNTPILGEKVKKIFNDRIEFLRVILVQSRDEGFLDKNVDCSILADIIFCTCRGICFRWRLYNYNFSLRDKCFKEVDMLLNIYKPRKKNIGV